MASEFIGFRLHTKKDRDILEALANAKDKTKEIKRLLRAGIQPSQPMKSLDWNSAFKEKPKPKEAPIVLDSIAVNILGGFD